MKSFLPQLLLLAAITSALTAEDETCDGGDLANVPHHTESFRYYARIVQFGVLCILFGGIIVWLIKSKIPPVFLKPDVWQDLPLLDKQVLSHNSQKFRFGLPTKNMVLGLPIGQHISLRATAADGKEVFRPYTPVTDDNHPGYVDFVIKIYPDGKMSQCLAKLAAGETLAFKGPRGKFQYKPRMHKAIGMLAGGSGITPMFQVVQAILRNPFDATPISLVYANVAEEDILLRERLDAWARSNAARFQVHYVLEKPPANWAGSSGYISKVCLQEHIPPPSPGVRILRCGPPAMMKAMAGLMDALSYTPEMQFEF